MNLIKKCKAVLCVLIFFAFLVLSESAYAGNASRMIGFSARDEAMAGATTVIKGTVLFN